jgi:tRNA(Ile2) C34 agmatinyltransferase TiaS
MMRDLFHHNEVNGVCPFCRAPIKTSDATIRLNCPSCKRLIEVRETTLEPGE